MVFRLIVFDGIEEYFFRDLICSLRYLFDEQIDTLFILLGLEPVEKLLHGCLIEQLKAFNETVKTVLHFLEPIQ